MLLAQLGLSVDVYPHWLHFALRSKVFGKIGASDMQIVCGKCEYYYVTHDRSRPWGCRKFGFKSSRLPSQEVRSTTGMNCAYFTEKNFNQTSERDRHGG